MGGRNAKTGLGDWGQFSFDSQNVSTDAGKFAHEGGTKEDYEGMTPEQRAQYLNLVGRYSKEHGYGKGYDEELHNFVSGIHSGNPAAPSAAASPEDTTNSLYSKLLAGLGDVSGARKSAVDAAYGQATSRLDPQWDHREQLMRARLLNQGLDPESEAARNSMSEFGRDRNDAYTSAQRSATLLGNEEAHNIMRDKLQAWLAQNNDELTRSGLLKGEQADQMAGLMKLLTSVYGGFMGS